MSSYHRFISRYYTPIKDAFIDKTRLQERESNAKTYFRIISSAATVLLAALELQHQAGNGSSFHNHPKTMAIAIASYLVFCMGCIIEQNYLRTTRRSSTSATLLYHSVRLMGYITVASLASVFFWTSTSSNLSLVVVYIIFSLLFSANWMLKWIRYKCSHRNRDSLPVHLRLRCTLDKLLEVPEYR